MFKIVDSGQIEPEFKLAIARWNTEELQSFSKFGQNPDIDTWAEDVWNWGWTYTWFPTWAAETLEIFSDSTADNWTTATWALTVEISWLLDWDYNEVSPITVTLDWTTAVSLWAWTFIRASRIKVLTAWAWWANAWIITLRHTTTTANIFAKLPVWNNQTTIMAFTVPAWKTFYADRVGIQMSRVNWWAWSAEVSIRVRELWWVFRWIRNPNLSNSQSYTYENNWYLVFTEKSDVKVRVDTVSDWNTAVSAEMDWIFIDN